MNKMYTENGHEVDFIENAKSGALVRFMMTGEGCYEGEEYQYLSEEISVYTGKLFDKPPTRAQNGEIAKLIEAIAGLREEKASVELGIRQAKEDAKAFIESLEKHLPLRKLSAILDGKITHFFQDRPHTFEIIDGEEMGYPSDSKSARALYFEFYSTRGGNEHRGRIMQNAYSDGSGSMTEVIPCESLEEALALAQAWLDKQDSPQPYAIRKAKQFGLIVKAEILDAARKKGNSDLMKTIAKKESEIWELEKLICN